MRKNKTRVFFLGSGRFAVPFLDVLSHSDSVELVGTGTQPDKPSGRKRLLTPTPLGSFADAAGIPCERYEHVSSESFLQILKDREVDMLVVVSFGQLLKPLILDFPKFGCLNVHGSILPKFRGAAPLASMILANEMETGVTFMRMDKGLDTGPIYAISRIPMPGDATRFSLDLSLSELGARHIVPVIERIAAGLQPTAQDNSKASVTRKIRKSDGSVCWSEPSELVALKIRAYYQWPGSAFRILGKSGYQLIKITSARVAEGSGAPGSTLCSEKRWIIACGSGAVEILKLIPEGSREMSASDFLRGIGTPSMIASVIDGPKPETKT